MNYNKLPETQKCSLIITQNAMKMYFKHINTKLVLNDGT